MSDLLSAAAVALGLWLFWRGSPRHWRYWLLSGFVASASTLFRESNILLFLPLFAGALFRGERKWPALLVGGTIGAGLRVALTTWMFGSALYLKDPYFGWSVAAAIHTLPLYLLALLVFVPGGLVAALMYRGSRRPEVITTVLMFFVFYVFYSYSAEESGPAKRLLIAPRYFIPLLPLLVFVLAESGPRAWAALARRLPRSINPASVLQIAARMAVVAVVVAAFTIHPVLAWWAKGDEAAVRAIYGHTPPEAIVIADEAVMKYLSPLYGERIVMGRERLAEAGKLTAAGSPVYLIVLDRSDSAYFRALLQENETILAAAATKCDLQPVDNLRIDASRRLRIWQLRSCR